MPVIETFFYWILFAGTILALIGQHKKLPMIIMLGAVFFVLAGALVQSNGIDLPTGYEWTETADGNYSSNVTYTTYQDFADYPELWMITMLLIFGGGILLLYGFWMLVYFYEESKREKREKANKW